MPDDLRRTVVVTGGNRGIGAAITRAFADDGWDVLIGARTDVSVTDNERVTFVQTDVRRPEALEALAETAWEKTGRLDAWVNCAGYSGWRKLADIDEAFYDDMMETNVKGTLFGCRAAAARFLGTGAIVNVSSIAGRRGSANNTVYCASKFSVTGITQSLAKELGPRGIRVNAVCPVYVRTKGLLEALEADDSPAGGGDVDAYLAAFAAGQAALRRLPEADEVAAAVLWLASDAASAVTGQSLHVDCGVMPG